MEAQSDNEGTRTDTQSSEIIILPIHERNGGKELIYWVSSLLLYKTQCWFSSLAHLLQFSQPHNVNTIIVIYKSGNLGLG